MTGQQGQVTCQRMAGALNVIVHAVQAAAQLIEVCQRAVAPQAALHRYASIPQA